MMKMTFDKIELNKGFDKDYFDLNNLLNNSTKKKKHQNKIIQVVLRLIPINQKQQKKIRRKKIQKPKQNKLQLSKILFILCIYLIILI